MTALYEPFYAVNRRSCLGPRMSDNAPLSDILANARKSGNVVRASWVVVRVSWLDSPEKCDTGVGFSQFMSGPASRFIGGLQPPKPGKSTSRTPGDGAVGA
jgi:hypothetical protein